MATADSNPYLTIQVKLDDQQLQQVLEKGGQKAEERASATQKRMQAIVDAGQAKITVSTAEAQSRREQFALNHQQKLEQKEQLHLQKLRQQQEAFQQRTANAYKSWSGQIARHMEVAANAIKAFVVFQAASLIKGSIEFTGQLADQADAVGLNVAQFYALKQAAANVDVEGQKVERILTRINLALESPNEKQASLFNRLGVDISQGAAPALDKLLTGIREGTVNLSDLADIVDGKSVLAFRKLALEVGSVNEATKKFKFPMTQEDVRTIDQAADSFHRLWDDVRIWTAKGFLGISRVFSETKASEEMRKMREEADKLSDSLKPIETAVPKAIVTSAQSADMARLAAEKAKIAWDSWLASVKASREVLLQIGQDMPELTPDNVGVISPLGGLRNQYNAQSSGRFQGALSQTESVERQRQAIAFAMQNFGQLQNLAQAAFALQSTYFQNEIQQQEYLMQKEQERWAERSGLLQEAGLQNSVIYRNEQRAHDAAQKAMAKQEVGIKSKAWDADQGARETGVVMTTAQAIMQALATTIPPYSFILSALYAGTGALQLASIEAQQNPYKGYRTGGWIQGRGYGDNIPFNGSAGEFVSTASNAQRNKSALEYMERGGTASGGGGTININISTVVGEKEWVRTNLLPQIKKAVRDGYSFN